MEQATCATARLKRDIIRAKGIYQDFLGRLLFRALHVRENELWE